MKPANEVEALVSRSVLLVDVNMKTRDSRAANMRKLGASVDPVASAAMALQRFAAGVYNLVLIDLGRDKDGAESLAREIRMKQPSQKIGFMVAGPRLIASTLGNATRPTTAFALKDTVASVDGETPFGRAIRDAEQDICRLAACWCTTRWPRC